MQIVFHTGAHATSDDRLMKCLLNNKDDFSKRGIAVPGPGRYRALLKESCKALESADPAPEARDVLIDAILDEDIADRVILSNASLFSTQSYALNEGVLYPRAGERLDQLSRLFALDEIEIFMAIRNPASFLPDVLSKADDKVVQKALSTVDLGSLRWSETLQRMRTAAPNVAITVWCYEDSPLIWAQIIRELAGLDHGEKISGGFDLLASIMSKEGMKRFRTYLHENPEFTEIQKRRVISAFLDKFAIDEELEEELDLPGWTEDLVDLMTDVYDEDVYEIQRIPGVQFLSP
ncbi:MAG: hypothetical protein ACU0BB_12485 [Paracoccaceae bacterium]